MILAGCATEPAAPIVYEWAKAEPRPASRETRLAIFRQDEAACEYEVAMNLRNSPQVPYYDRNPEMAALGSAVMSTGGHRYYQDLCLAAKGWQRIQ